MVKSTKKYKIALVGYTLEKGGLEKVISNLSMLFDKNELDIYNVILTDNIGYPFGGKLFNLEKEYGDFHGFKILKYFYLYKFFRKNKFDYIIDFRYRLNPITEFIFAKIVYNPKTIYTIHSSKIDTYLPNNKMLTRFIYSNNFGFVCSCKGIENELADKHQFSNVRTIYNPISFEKINTSVENQNVIFPFEFVLAVGRFEKNNVKQFDKLIETYLLTDLANQNIHLVLVGDGETWESFCQKYENMEYIHFEGFQNNPYVYMHQAKFFVLCSKYEGFPMVIAEALASGCPVVSFDCKTGPNEIIIHETNGLLVADQNFHALKESMEKLCRETDLLDFCRTNAVDSVMKFDVAFNFKKWLKLFNSK